jgi:hypothetical protein
VDGAVGIDQLDAPGVLVAGDLGEAGSEVERLIRDECDASMAVPALRPVDPSLAEAARPVVDQCRALREGNRARAAIRAASSPRGARRRHQRLVSRGRSRGHCPTRAPGLLGASRAREAPGDPDPHALQLRALPVAHAQDDLEWSGGLARTVPFGASRQVPLNSGNVTPSGRQEIWIAVAR